MARCTYRAVFLYSCYQLSFLVFDILLGYFFFSSRRRHTRCLSDWSSDVCSSDLEDKVGIVADPLRPVKLKVGDHLLMDSKSGYLLEKLPKSEVEDLTLEEVPDIGYEIGRASCRERV